MDAIKVDVRVEDLKQQSWEELVHDMLGEDADKEFYPACGSSNPYDLSTNNCDCFGGIDENLGTDYK
jgi:hypothetical protein